MPDADGQSESSFPVRIFAHRAPITEATQRMHAMPVSFVIVVVFHSFLSDNYITPKPEDPFVRILENFVLFSFNFIVRGVEPSETSMVGRPKKKNMPSSILSGSMDPPGNTDAIPTNEGDRTPLKTSAPKPDRDSISRRHNYSSGTIFRSFVTATRSSRAGWNPTTEKTARIGFPSSDEHNCTHTYLRRKAARDAKSEVDLAMENILDG